MGLSRRKSGTEGVGEGGTAESRAKSWVHVVMVTEPRGAWQWVYVNEEDEREGGPMMRMAAGPLQVRLLWRV